MFSVKGIGIKIFALIMGVIAIGVGAYLTFFQSRGYVKTEATIVSIEDVSTEDIATNERNESYRAKVEYTVDGTTYTSFLDTESPSYKVGQTVSVRYNPNDPAVVHGDSMIGLYAMGVGALILVVILVTEIRKRTSLKDVRAQQQAQGGVVYPASVPGPLRKLYFATDLGTAKAGHRLEDAGKNVLYEAKMTKYTLTAPFGFDFIDREHGKTTPHLVGHEESTDWGNSFLLDNHFTFTFDGEDIWKHLRRNGITVDSSLTDGVRVEYRISRDGREIAVATGSSQNVHEEDEAAKSKLSSLVPVQGFYRVETTETDLSLLFVTLLAFARSGASDDHGGSRRMLWNTLNK